jgi:hypothetical protein
MAEENQVQPVRTVGLQADIRIKQGHPDYEGVVSTRPQLYVYK